MRLPPGVTSADFLAAVKEFEAAVGKEWVFTSDEDVDLYRDSYSPFWHEDEEPVPSAAVAPDGVEQVQAIVRTANRYKIPLWTISTGKNLGYGGSAPLLGGSVVLDLKRMDRILEVNDKNHYALVEPGVSYFDLYRYIQDKGLKVWIDPADPGWGSLIGNAVDRGGGRTPMRDHFDAVCGMEVVLPSGEVMRTGMGALPNSKTWQQYKYGFGPYVTPIFSQSSLGIVTKMGIWLLPEPEAYLTGTVMVPRRDDLIPLIAGMAYLMNSSIVMGTTSVGSPLNFLRPDGELAALRAKPGGPSTEDLEQYLRARNMGYWSVELPFYGPEKVVAGAVGIREAETLDDRRRYVSGRQAASISDRSRGGSELPEFRGRGHTEPFGVWRRRRSQLRSRLVFTHRPDDGRSGAGSAPGFHQCLPRIRNAHGTDVLSRPRVELPALLSDSFRFSDRARRGPRTNRTARISSE